MQEKNPGFQISGETYKRALKCLKRKHNPPALQMLMVFILFIVAAPFIADVISKKLLAMIILSLFGLNIVWFVWLIFTSARRRYQNVLPQVLKELYPDYTFMQTGNAKSMRSALPALVRERSHGVDEYHGTLRARSSYGDVLIHSIVGRTDDSDSTSTWSWLVYEFPPAPQLSGGQESFLELYCLRPFAPGHRRSPIGTALMSLIHKAEIRFPGKNITTGEIENTPLAYRTNQPERSRMVLQPKFIQSVLDYYSANSDNDLIIFFQNRLYLMASNTSFAFEHGKIRKYSPEFFNQNAVNVRNRIDLGLRLLDMNL